MAASPLVQGQGGQEIDEQQTPIDEADALWFKLADKYPFLLEDTPNIDEKRKQLQRKEVVISAFGRHNCGKSTLLNVITGNSCLPIDEDNETCIEIKIRHDGEVHPGLCKESCSGQCPRLLREDGAAIVATGAKTICRALKKANSDHRSQTTSGEQKHHEHQCFVLHAHVPILEAPAGWTITLLDTPGFGEANVDQIMKRADTLFNTSTAYVYLMDATSMEDKVDSDNIAILFNRDNGIFHDGRFVVAVNKFDIRLSQQSTRHTREEEEISAADSLRSLKKKTLSFIANTVKCQQSPCVDIVPVCAYWAEIALWLKEFPENKKDRKQASRIIEDFPDLQQKGLGMAETVEKMSQLETLEQRLSKMIDNCIYVWKTSLASAYIGYLRDATLALEKHRQKLWKEKENVENKLVVYKKYEINYDMLKEKAAVTNPYIVTNVKEKFENNDVKPAKEFFRCSIGVQVKQFTSEMKHNVFQLSPTEFEEKVCEFQKEVEKHLNKEQPCVKLDGAGSQFMATLNDTRKLKRKVEQLARDILQNDQPSANPDLIEDEEDLGFVSSEVLKEETLTLGGLSKWEKPPELDVGVWQMIVNFIGYLFDKDPHYDHWTSEMTARFDEIEKDLIKVVDSYVTGNLQQCVIKVLSNKYRAIVQSQCDALSAKFGAAIEESKSKLEEEYRNYETTLKDLEADIQKVQAAQEKLEKWYQEISDSSKYGTPV